LEISIAWFTVAGGILLTILSFRILLQGGEGWNRDATTSGILPLAFPLLAGPGAVTTAIFSINALGIPFSLIPIVAVMTVTWVVLLSIDKLLTIIGETEVDAIARIMSVFIAAIGVHYIVTGSLESTRPI
jgi:multiple antibiotic resistance protein